MQNKPFMYRTDNTERSPAFTAVNEMATDLIHGQWIAIVAPPMTLTAQHLTQQGIATESALVIHSAKIGNKFLTLLKAAQSPTIASIVTWDDKLTADEIFQIRATMKAYNKPCLIHPSKKLH
jgi:cell division inhibitor SulA